MGVQKMGYVSPPTHSVKLKIIYGHKVSKTADLDTISIQFFFTSTCIMYMVGGYFREGGGVSALPHPP